MSGPEIEIRRSKHPKPKVDAAQLGFGRVFTDHMLLMEYDGGAWGQPRIEPYGPLSLEPSSTVFHYGQAMFEGMKAFRGKDGKVRLFRPGRHAQRMAGGAARLCMPALEPEQMASCVHALVSVDEGWVPSA